MARAKWRASAFLLWVLLAGTSVAQAVTTTLLCKHAGPEYKDSDRRYFIESDGRTRVLSRLGAHRTPLSAYTWVNGDVYRIGMLGGLTKDGRPLGYIEVVIDRYTGHAYATDIALTADDAKAGKPMVELLRMKASAAAQHISERVEYWRSRVPEGHFLEKRRKVLLEQQCERFEGPKL